MKLSLIPKYIDILLYSIFLILFPTSVYISLYFPNVILEQGLSHRIFYLHVSCAWVALYAPFFSFLFSSVYIWKKDLKWDTLGFSMNVVAFLFALSVLISGPIWAYSAWGVPWDWTDARLQSFFVLVISLIAYFVTRSLISDIQLRAKISSFLSILCVINSVLTWGAIRWIENPGNHPGSVLGKSGMDSDMKLAFFMSVFAYHVLFLLLFIIIHRYAATQSLLTYLKQTMDN